MKWIILPVLLAVLASLSGCWIHPVAEEVDLKTAFPDLDPPPMTPDGNEDSRRRFGDTYYLGVDDILTIEVADHPEFSGDVTVRKDGKVGMPRLEKAHGAVIHAKDRTTEQVADAIRDLITPYVIGSPAVVVTLREALSRYFFTMGFVRREGRYLMGDKQVTLRRALFSAGFFRNGADRANVYVITPDETNPTYVSIDAWEVLTGKMENNIILKPNDIVFIKPTVWHMTWSVITEIVSRSGSLQDADYTFDVWDKDPPIFGGGTDQTIPRRR